QVEVHPFLGYLSHRRCAGAAPGSRHQVLPMSMIPGQLEFVIGVDTHKSRHTVALVDHLGGLIASTSVAATAAASSWLMEWLEDRAAGVRVWSVAGTSGYGAGLTDRQHLLEVTP